MIFRQLTFRSDKGCRTYRKVRFACEHLLHRLWCHCADFL
ncbi:Uncharacterised protein [Vibrio cholerae]|nr:Uncharacterised protein [Vibrio cholerae]